MFRFVPPFPPAGGYCGSGF